MAVPKIATPNPAALDPSSIEQIYAKGTLAKDNTAGLAYLMMQNAQTERERGSEAYLGSLDRANSMANGLARFEAEQKIREERLKVNAGLMKEGFNATDLENGADVGKGEGLNAVSALIQDVLRSTAQKNRMPHGGGGGSKDGVTFKEEYFPVGTNGERILGGTSVSSKSSDPAQAAANAAAAVRARMPGVMAGTSVQQSEAKRLYDLNKRYPGSNLE